MSLKQYTPPQHIISPAEQTAYTKLFNLADSSKQGVITPQIAVAFLSKSKLPHETLGKIWTLSDSEGRGFLTQQSFYMALKWISIAQSGKEPSIENLNSTAPLPVFEGISNVDSNDSLKKQPVTSTTATNIPSNAKSIQLTSTTTPSLPSISKENESQLVITLEEKERLSSAFVACDPVDGYITGESAREVFVQSGLSLEILGQVWRLVDPEGTGKINLNQFVASMYIILKLRQEILLSVPSTMPSSLWNSILNAGNDKGMPISSIMEPRGSFTQSSSVQSVPQVAWILPEADKKQFYSFFEKLDKSKLGYITGEQSYAFFLKSKLPEEHLAEVWELSDVLKSGQLNQEEFALAMFLIKQKMSGKELPKFLPLEYIPPCRRRRITGSSIGNNVNDKTVVAPPAPFPVNLLSSPVESIAPGLSKPFDNTVLTSDESNPLKSLQESIHDMSRKKQVYQSEVASLSSQKVNIQEEMTRLKSLYDTELLSVSELQGSLAREKQNLEITKAECNELNGKSNALKEEKLRLELELNQIKASNAETKKLIKEFTDMCTSAKLELDKISVETRQQAQFLELNRKMASDASYEAQGLSVQLNMAKTQLENMKVSNNPNPVGASVGTPIATPLNNATPPIVGGNSFASLDRGPPPPVPISKKPGRKESESSIFPLTNPSNTSIVSSPTPSVLSIQSSSKPINPSITQAVKDEMDLLMSSNKPKNASGISDSDIKRSDSPFPPSGGSGSTSGGFVPVFSGPKGTPSIKSISSTVQADFSNATFSTKKPSSLRSFAMTSGNEETKTTNSVILEEEMDLSSFSIQPNQGQTWPSDTFTSNNPLSDSAASTGFFNSIKAESSLGSQKVLNADAEFKNAFNIDSLSPIVPNPVVNNPDLDSAFDFSLAFSSPAKGFHDVVVPGSVSKPTAGPTPHSGQVNTFSAAFTNTPDFPSFTGFDQPVASLTDYDLENAFTTSPPSNQGNIQDPFDLEGAGQVNELMNLGFTRDESINALKLYDNNVERASNYLLDSANNKK